MLGMMACVHSSFKNQSYFVNYFLNMKLRRKTPEEEVIFFFSAPANWSLFQVALSPDLAAPWPEQPPFCAVHIGHIPKRDQFDLKVRKVPKQIVMILSWFLRGAEVLRGMLQIPRI